MTMSDALCSRDKTLGKRRTTSWEQLSYIMGNSYPCSFSHSDSVARVLRGLNLWASFTWWSSTLVYIIATIMIKAQTLWCHSYRLNINNEKWTEGGSRLEHHSDVEVLIHPPDPLTDVNYVRKVDMRLVASSPPLPCYQELTSMCISKPQRSYIYKLRRISIWSKPQLVWHN